MIEKWKEVVDKNQSLGALLTDLSKTLTVLAMTPWLTDCKITVVWHFLAIIKITNWLFDKSKITSKIGNFLQILGKDWTWHSSRIYLKTTFFNILISNLLLILDQTYLVNYASDKKPYTVNENVEEVIQTLEEITKLLLKWLKSNK